MEINNVIGEIKPVITQEEITEGLMVVLTTNTNDWDFGSHSDLLGVKLPASADEGKRARFIITWPTTNQKPPFYSPVSSLMQSYALRGGFDNTSNLPLTSMTIYPTYPGYQNGVAIPSGVPARAFGHGTYTVPSGSFVATSLAKGSLLSVAYTAPSKGKLQLQSTFDADVVVGIVDSINTDSSMTFTLMEF